MSEASSAPPRRSAAVILLRDSGRGAELEVFLLRRHRKANFMASAFVFPGGIEEPEDGGDARITAARELFEEAGVLLCADDVADDARERWRGLVNQGRAAAEVLGGEGLAFQTGCLHYYAHWLTPTIEKRRYSAQFFVARLPDGQEPVFDNIETVDQAWVTPTEGLERARELHLPPPQVRMLMDLREPATGGWDAVVADAAERAENRAIILPRFAPAERGFALLLPWDPDYVARGQGEAIEMPADHPLAVGPSRFILEDETWKNIEAPASPNAG